MTREVCLASWVTWVCDKDVGLVRSTRMVGGGWKSSVYEIDGGLDDLPSKGEYTELRSDWMWDELI